MYVQMFVILPFKSLLLNQYIRYIYLKTYLPTLTYVNKDINEDWLAIKQLSQKDKFWGRQLVIGYFMKAWRFNQ